MNFLVYSYLSIMSSSVVVVGACSPDEEPWKRVKLVAVTNFRDLPEYYQHIKQRKALETAPQSSTKPLDLKENVNIKKNICKYIFNSDYFHMIEEDWLNTDLPPVYNELRSKKRRIFKSLYSTNRRKLRTWLNPLMCGIQHDYINAIQLHSVSIKARNKENEYGFLCLVRKRPSQAIKEYYISEEYNVNEAYVNPNAAYITGRFIFEYDNWKELVVSAMAEESAKVLAQGIAAEKLYASDGWNARYALSETPEENPICRLSISDKLRLCAAILSSAPFEGQVEYFPTVESVAGDCERREISFTDDDLKEMAGSGTYQEWTIVCQPSVRSNTLIKPAYYVSGAVDCNKVFVHYSFYTGKYLYPEFYFDRIRVIPC